MNFIAIPLMFIFIIPFSGLVYAKDINIPNHPLLGTEILTPDYTLVIEGNNPSSTDSEIDIKYNARLTTLSARASMAAYPSENLKVVTIFPPNTKFIVSGIYFNKPSLIKSMFVSGYHFAVLEKEGKKHTVGPVTNFDNNWKIQFEANDCKKIRPCSYWRHAIKNCLETKAGQNCYVFYGLYIKDNNFKTVWDRNIRPPYKKNWVDNSIKAFDEHAKQNNLDIMIDKIHLTINAKITALELANTFLQYENLNIKNVGPLSFGEDTTWLRLKEFRSSNQ